MNHEYWVWLFKIKKYHTLHC